MNQKELSWICVRVLGLIYALFSINVVLYIPIYFIVFMDPGPPSPRSLYFIVFGLMQRLPPLFFAVYFLWFGNAAYKIVKGSVNGEAGIVDKASATNLIVRAIGVFFISRLVVEAYMLVLRSVQLFALKDVAEHYPMWDITASVHSIKVEMINSAIMILLFALLVYYCLFKGKLLGRLLCKSPEGAMGQKVIKD